MHYDDSKVMRGGKGKKKKKMLFFQVSHELFFLLVSFCYETYSEEDKSELESEVSESFRMRFWKENSSVLAF